MDSTVENENLIQNVLRMHIAGKEDPEDAGESRKTTPVQRKRYYFYEAHPENAIKFTALSDILKRKSPEREALIEKLKGGYTGEYCADYFRWKKLVVVTNEYAPDLLVYEADLTSIGAKIPGSVNIYPQDAAVSTDMVERDLLLFKDQRGSSSIINIDSSSESEFANDDPPNNIARILLSRSVPPGDLLPYDAFVRCFDEYRIWVPNLNQLLLPDFGTPKTDDVRGGHYTGGREAYERLVGPIEEELKAETSKEKSKSLGEMVEKKEEGSKFEPVSKETEPVSGDYIDRTPGSTKTAREKGDYSSEPYSGGMDVLQKLVKEQRKHMKIRKMATRIVNSFLEKQSAVTQTAPAKGYTAPAMPKTKGTTGLPSSKKLQEQGEEIKKKYEELANTVKEMEKVTQ
jgi:hypothetical protein